MQYAFLALSLLLVTMQPGRWNTTVEQIATLVEQEYIDAAAATRVATSVRSELKLGHYDQAKSPTDLAQMLTRDLLRFSKDRHLAVTVTRPPTAPTGAPVPRAEAARRANGGVQRVEILDGNIGYLNLTSFWRLDEAHDAIIAALKLLAHADALIIDMRSNGGGNPATVELLMGELLQAPNTKLFDIVSRDGQVNSYTTPATLEVAAKPRPMFVLTSMRTFSAGEGFAFLLQERKAAVVIGEDTPGAANPGAPHPVGDLFEVTIPNGIVKSAISGKNWEGTGVTPDVAVPAEGALDAAITRARQRLLSQR